VRNKNELQRVIDALDNIAAELERLRVLKEYESGVHI
jgi:exonuclease VII small subunit